MIEMLGVHVQHNGVLRTELAQRAVAFVGFDHKMRSAERGVGSEPRVAFELQHGRADGVAWSRLQLFKREAEQRAGRRFPVHTSDADAALSLDQTRQEECAP